MVYLLWHMLDSNSSPLRISTYTRCHTAAARSRLSALNKMAARNLSGLSKAVRELRIHLCQKSPGSQGARYVDFVFKDSSINEQKFSTELINL